MIEVLLILFAVIMVGMAIVLSVPTTKLKEQENSTYENSIELKTQSAWDNVTLTTTPFVSGKQIEREIEIITAECVYGMNIFRDFFAGFSDFFGGRSESSQKILRDARKNCLNELKREAFQVNADAVVGVKLDYSEFSGKGKSMLFLVASGTAVKLKQ